MLINIDWVFCFFMAVIALLLFYQAFINLVKKRYSHFGVDALMVYINLKLAGKKRRKYVESHIADSERVHRRGVNTLLLGIGFILGLIVTAQPSESKI